MKEEYISIENSQETLIKIKGSKFYGYAFHVKSDAEVKKSLEEIKVIHPQARHHCYAYRFGFGPMQSIRMNDAGEPNYSAGKPIFGQIESFSLDNILVVVVRYFGGTKLGVGGLISAYKDSAKLTLESSDLRRFQILETISIEFDFSKISEIETIISQQNLEVLSREFLINKCVFAFNLSNSQITFLEELNYVTIVT